MNSRVRPALREPYTSFGGHQRSLVLTVDTKMLVSSVDTMTRIARPAARHARPADPAHAAAEALHGWAISERIQQISEDVLQINQGSLYPALHRLEHQGWIEAEWAVSELGRRAKYYRLTAVRPPPAGRRNARVGTHVERHRPGDEAGLTIMNLRDLRLRAARAAQAAVASSASSTTSSPSTSSARRRSSSTRD